MTTTSIETATFGAGCFWSTDKCFRKQFGVHLMSAVVGYMDNASTNNCDDVSTSGTNHIEVLQMSYDTQKVAYDDLVRFFFHMHDPTRSTQSGNVRSNQYRSVIFTHTQEQHKIAEKVLDEVQTSGNINGKIVTEIQPVSDLQFRIAEQKHQNYLEKKYGWLME